MGATSAATPLCTESLPSWAQRLLKRPLVEIRRGLSLDYDPPSEESSVIVLTAPSGKYVDIRFPLSPDHRSPVKKASDSIAAYATAGLSTASNPTGTESCVPYECTVHVKWEHPIDSSGSFATNGADMYLLANGDTMEIGTMTIDGKLRMFKEYWVEPKGVDTSVYTVLETKANGPGSGKGMAIRIGDYCQGIFQTEGQFWVERWELKEGRWEKDERSNTRSENAILPCQWMIKSTKPQGDSVIINGREWIVTERSEAL